MQDFGFTHLSAGDLLREEVAKGTSQGKQLEDMMKQGKLVPAVSTHYSSTPSVLQAPLNGISPLQEVTVGLLKQAILSHPEAVGFLIDGFPRELSQAPLFTQQVSPWSPCYASHPPLLIPSTRSVSVPWF